MEFVNYKEELALPGGTGRPQKGFDKEREILQNGIIFV
jgi:hypothetical protein